MDWSGVLSGGPPKDGIPAIDAPAFIPACSETCPGAREPVITLEHSGAAPRALSVRCLMWHEIVNDEIAGMPVAFTCCTLCNSGMVLDQRIGGQALSFGVSGKLRHSDVILCDHQSESWWQKATEKDIVGQHAEVALT